MFLRRASVFHCESSFTGVRLAKTQLSPARTTHPEAPTNIVHPPRGRQHPHTGFDTLCTDAASPVQTKMSAVRDTAPIRFPFNGFTHFFTLSSEVFSSFPHGTCSLSVSCQYLALDEVYHPLRTALSSNPTHGKGITEADESGNRERGSHPLWQLIPKHFGRLSARTLPR